MADSDAGESDTGGVTTDSGTGGSGSGGADGGGMAGAPLAGSVRLDLVLPGKNRSFLRIWSFGDNAQTSGIATSRDGVVYSTKGGGVYALDGQTGATQWSNDCAVWGGCNSASSSGAAVFAGLRTGGIAKLAPADGKAQCAYAPTGLGSAQPGSLLATSSRIVYANSIVVGIDAADCKELYRLTSPNGENVGSVSVSEELDRLFVAWDNPGGNTARMDIYRLSDATPVCHFEGNEYFRTMINQGRIMGGWSRLRSNDVNTCAAGPAFLSSNYGDVRDIAANATRNQLLALTSNDGEHGLYLLDATTFAQRDVFRDFYENGIFTLNKMAPAGDWVFVPDGNTPDTGRIHVLETSTGAFKELGSFERGRINRLGDRIVDGGLLLTNVQQSTGSEPLTAFRVGDGDFVGQSYLYGSPDGNKYCSKCLTRLRYVEADCSQYMTTGFRCAVTNQYDGVVNDVTLAGLPPGAWNVTSESGIPVAAGVSNEAPLKDPFAPGATRVYLLTPK